ncbi:MAG: hypothetical protein M3Z23_11945 [Acidobacteriota bacterium]|nr:hypothetical protein [Acidobacteriota bacterium]
MVPVEPEPVVSRPPDARQSAQPLAVNFRNPLAVRISLMVASFAAMLDAIPFLDLLFVVWSIAAGFLSVVLYRHRTGQILSVKGGAKMGWITGVLTFVIVTVLITVTFVASGPALGNIYREQLGKMAAQDQAAAHLLESPYTLAMFVLISLLFMFCVFAGACMAGGALGARISRRDS